MSKAGRPPKQKTITQSSAEKTAEALNLARAKFAKTKAAADGEALKKAEEANISIQKMVRRERFILIAVPRVETTLRTLKGLGGCNNPRTYLYTVEDLERIFQAIDAAAAEAKKRLSEGLNATPAASEPVKFSLDPV